MHEVNPSGVIFYLLLSKPEINVGELREVCDKIQVQITSNGYKSWTYMDISRDSLYSISHDEDIKIDNGVISRVDFIVDRYNLEYFNLYYKHYIPDKMYKILQKKYPLSKDVRKKMPPFKKYVCVVESRIQNAKDLKKHIGMGRVIDVKELLESANLKGGGVSKRGRRKVK